MVISERIRAKLAGTAENPSFCWLEKKTLKKNRLLSYKYYNGFTLNSQTYKEGDCVLINIGSLFCSSDKHDIARIIECFDNGSKGYKGFVKVQWFTPIENIRKAHKKYIDTENFPPLEEDIEIVKDTWTYEDEVDVETISGHCWIEEVTANCVPSKVKRPASALGPLYVCRYIYQKSSPYIVPIIKSTVYKAEKSPLALREITNSPKTCKDSAVKLKKQSAKKDESKYSAAKNQFDSPLSTRLKSVNIDLNESRRSVKRKLLDLDEEDEKNVSMKKRRKNVCHDHENGLSKKMSLPLTPVKENRMTLSKSSGKKKNSLIEMPSLLTPKKESNITSPKSLEKNKKKVEIGKSPSNKIENIISIGQCRGLQQTEISELLSDDDESSNNGDEKFEKYKIQKGSKSSTCNDDGIRKSSRKKTKPKYNIPSSDDDVDCKGKKKFEESTEDEDFEEYKNNRVNSTLCNGVRKSSRKTRKPKAYIFSSDDEYNEEKELVVNKKNKKVNDDLSRLTHSPSKTERTPKKSEPIKNNSNTPRRSILKNELDSNEIKTPKAVVKNLIVNGITTPKSSKKSSNYSESTPKSIKKVSSDSIATPKSFKKLSSDSIATPKSIKKVSSDTVATPKSSKKNCTDSLGTPKSRKKVSGNTLATPKSEKNKSSKLSEKGKTPKSMNKTRFSKLPDRNNPIEECKSEFEQAKAQLHVSAVPSYLPCREDEFQQIFSFVEGKLLDSTGGCMYVSGVPGTGKTATVREVVKVLRDCEQNGTLPIFQYLEVNAMKLTKPHQLWVEIWEGISGERVTPDHAYSLFEKWLKSSSGPKRKSVFLLLDELDLLWTKKQDVMYNLFDLSTRIDSRLIVVTIANTMDLPERMMISRVSSRLGLTRMTFQPYTFKQLQEIITSRLQGIKAFDSDAIQLVARKVAAVSGDARRALDICRRATELGELKKTDILSSPLKSPKKANFLVGMAHVTMAISEMFSSPKVTAIRQCSQMVKYLLQAIMAEFSRTGIEEALLMKVLEHLQSVCRLDGLPPPSFSDTMKLINVLSAQKIIFTEHSRLDLLLRIRLNISTEDVSYALSLDKS